jgi:hypothetical protein
MGVQMKNVILLAIVAAAIVTWDYKAGSILPNEMYCLLGAGFSDRVPSRETAWHIDPSSGRQTPYQWSVESQVCLHATLWDAYRSKLQRAGLLSATP